MPKRRLTYDSVKDMPLSKLKKVMRRRNRAPRSYRSGARVKGSIARYGGRQELKYVDTDLTGGTALYDTTGLATPVNLLAIGDDNTSRDGRQVTVKSIQVQGSVFPVDQGAGPTLCRSMIVWDAMNNSASTTSAQLIAALLQASTSNAFPLIDNQQRFTVLWDSHKMLGQISNTATQALSPNPGAHILKYYRKISQVTQYSGTTAAIGSIQSGALWFVTLGDNAAGVGGQFIGRVRVRFTDN
ncbi:putative capsid protein [Giant house spider associated circular virus 4]|uniref:putative capsid protein n=1 Tax=Giant house spider associated circular virus 4 TaxID=2293291 RepID=UPI000E3312D8|nr:putative capsid protein [Giant house spider associated circular virus 4]AXL65943.1 putative capsid protein [Giant house spider associated circular virus 4]